MATIHDYDGELVAYSLSASAYTPKAHPRNTKRSVRASPYDSEGTEHSGQRRRIVTASSTSIAGNHALPSSSSAADSADRQQPGEPANTSGPPVVEPAVNRSVGMLTPMVDLRLQSTVHDPHNLLSSNPTEGYQPMPTLDEAVPSNCTWRGGIFISLFVSNLPPDGPLYARFGLTVVKTVRVQCNSLRVADRLDIGSEDP